MTTLNKTIEYWERVSFVSLSGVTLRDTLPLRWHLIVRREVYSWQARW